MTEGDAERRFTGMFDAYEARVYAYAVSRVGCQLADDVVGETFLVAWRKLDSAPDPALPWLLGVARNVVRERYREEVRQAALASESLAWVQEAGADVADGVAERAAVLEAIRGLSDGDRELLTLVAWQGLSAGAAATVLGCSKAAFSVRLHRARKRLREALAGTPRVVPPAPIRTTAEEYGR